MNVNSQNKKQDLSSLLKDSQTNKLRQLLLGTSDTQRSTCRQVQKQYWTNGVIFVVCNLSQRHSSVKGLCKTLDGDVS